VKPTASDVSVSLLGLINFQVDLLPIAQSASSGPSFKMICVTCPKPTPVNQNYSCGKGHGPFKQADLPKALEVGKTLQRVTLEEITALREPQLPPKELSLSAFPTEQVEAATRPGGSTYRVRAERNQALVQMVTDLVASGEATFLGELNLSGTQKLYRLAVWKDTLVLEELVRPDMVHPFEATPTLYDARLLEQARQLTEIQLDDFDPVQYRNFVRERTVALAAKADGAPVVAAVPAPVKDPAADLLAALEAAVAAKAA
jgi:non-homologous end joining protein Ku